MRQLLGIGTSRGPLGRLAAALGTLIMLIRALWPPVTRRWPSKPIFYAKACLDRAIRPRTLWREGTSFHHELPEEVAEKRMIMPSAYPVHTSRHADCAAIGVRPSMLDGANRARSVPHVDQQWRRLRGCCGGSCGSRRSVAHSRSLMSVARYTSACPNAPNTGPISYGPRRVPLSSGMNAGRILIVKPEETPGSRPVVRQNGGGFAVASSS